MATSLQLQLSGPSPPPSRIGIRRAPMTAVREPVSRMSAYTADANLHYSELLRKMDGKASSSLLSASALQRLDQAAEESLSKLKEEQRQKEIKQQSKELLDQAFSALDVRMEAARRGMDVEEVMTEREDARITGRATLQQSSIVGVGEESSSSRSPPRRTNNFMRDLDGDDILESKSLSRKQNALLGGLREQLAMLRHQPQEYRQFKQRVEEYKRQRTGRAGPAAKERVTEYKQKVWAMSRSALTQTVRQRQEEHDQKVVDVQKKKHRLEEAKREAVVNAINERNHRQMLAKKKQMREERQQRWLSFVIIASRAQFLALKMKAVRDVEHETERRFFAVQVIQKAFRRWYTLRKAKKLSLGIRKLRELIRCFAEKKRQAKKIRSSDIILEFLKAVANTQSAVRGVKRFTSRIRVIQRAWRRLAVLRLHQTIVWCVAIDKMTRIAKEEQAQAEAREKAKKRGRRMSVKGRPGVSSAKKSGKDSADSSERESTRELERDPWERLLFHRAQKKSLSPSDYHYMDQIDHDIRREALRSLFYQRRYQYIKDSEKYVGIYHHWRQEIDAQLQMDQAKALVQEGRQVTKEELIVEKYSHIAPQKPRLYVLLNDQELKQGWEAMRTLQCERDQPRFDAYLSSDLVQPRRGSVMISLSAMPSPSASIHEDDARKEEKSENEA